MYSFKQSKLLAVVVMLMNLSAFAQTPAAPAAAPAATESSTTPLGVTTKDYAKEAGAQSRITKAVENCNKFRDEYSDLRNKVPGGCINLISKCISNLDSTETGMVEGYMQALGMGVGGQSVLPTTNNGKVNCALNFKEWNAEDDKYAKEQKENAKDRRTLDKNETDYEKEYQDALKKIQESEIQLTKDLQEIQDKQLAEERDAALQSTKVLADATKKERQLVEEMSNVRKAYHKTFNQQKSILVNKSMDKITMVCEEKIGFMTADFCSKAQNATDPKCKKQTYGGLGIATSAGSNNIKRKKILYNSCIEESLINLNNAINENAEDLKGLQERLTSIAQEIDSTKKAQDAEMNHLQSSMQQLRATNQRKKQVAHQEYQQLLEQRQSLQQMQMQKKFNLMKQRMEEGSIAYNTMAKRNRLGVASQECGALSVNEASISIKQMIQRKENALNDCCGKTLPGMDGTPLLNNNSPICTGNVKDEIKSLKKGTEDLGSYLDGDSSGTK